MITPLYSCILFVSRPVTQPQTTMMQASPKPSISRPPKRCLQSSATDPPEWGEIEIVVDIAVIYIYKLTEVLAACFFMQLLLRFDWQTVISQSARADHAQPTFYHLFIWWLKIHFISQFLSPKNLLITFLDRILYCELNVSFYDL